METCAAGAQEERGGPEGLEPVAGAEELADLLRFARMLLEERVRLVTERAEHVPAGTAFEVTDILGSERRQGGIRMKVQLDFHVFPPCV